MGLEHRPRGYVPECICPALCSEDVLHDVVYNAPVSQCHRFLSRKIAWKYFGEVTAGPPPSPYICHYCWCTRCQVVPCRVYTDIPRRAVMFANSRAWRAVHFACTCGRSWTAMTAWPDPVFGSAAVTGSVQSAHVIGRHATLLYTALRLLQLHLLTSCYDNRYETMC